MQIILLDAILTYRISIATAMRTSPPPHRPDAICRLPAACLLMLLLGASLAAPAQEYPLWQRVYVSAEGAYLPWNVYPPGYPWRTKEGGSFQVQLGYQHSNRVGWGAHAGVYQNTIITRFPTVHQWGMIGLGVHYRMIFGSFQAQAGAGLIAAWTDHLDGSGSLHHMSMQGNTLSDNFFELRLSWRPVPSVNIGLVGVCTSQLTMSHFYRRTYAHPVTGLPVWVTIPHGISYSLVQPFVGIQLPGRWEGWVERHHRPWRKSPRSTASRRRT